MKLPFILVAGNKNTSTEPHIKENIKGENAHAARSLSRAHSPLLHASAWEGEGARKVPDGSHDPHRTGVKTRNNEGLCPGGESQETSERAEMTLEGVITALQNASSSCFKYTDIKHTGNRKGNRWHTETEMDLLSFTVKKTCKMRKGGNEERNPQEEKNPHTSAVMEKNSFMI